MEDPKNHLEMIYPSFIKTMEHFNYICHIKYQINLNVRLLLDIHEQSKPDALARLYSCDSIDTRRQRRRYNNIAMDDKKTMCLQLLEARYFDRYENKDKNLVACNSSLCRPWCRQEWILPGLGLLSNAFSPSFDSGSLMESLRAQAQDLRIEADEKTFSKCFAVTANIFCELLFMYLMVNWRNMPIAKMEQYHTRYH